MKKAFPMRDRSSQPSVLEATEGERSEPQGAGMALARPDPEVAEKARHRKFSTEYKLRVLRLADSCTDPGSLGRLLRKEGLYASNLTTWRRQREQSFHDMGFGERWHMDSLWPRRLSDSSQAGTALALFVSA